MSRISTSAPCFDQVTFGGEIFREVSGVVGCYEGKARTPTPRRPRTETETRSTVTTAVALGASALSAADRCDRCGAQAYLRVEMPSGAELYFCAHHGREHSDALRQVATSIQDETERLRPSHAGASGAS